MHAAAGDDTLPRMEDLGSTDAQPVHRHFTVTGFVSDAGLGGRTALHWHRLGIWLPPGGHIETDEDPVQAMFREVREETGLEVEIVSGGPAFGYLRPPQLPPPAAMAVYDIPRDSQLDEPHQHIDFIYFTRPVTPDPSLPDDGMQWRWFDRDDLTRSTELNEDIRELGLAAIDAAEAAAIAAS
ncbi:MAG: NUDIX domain-containing protein [Chloroflexi bacterium]|nr:NUDIX domain-containing protein [Chloroflexota bacterium]